MWYVVLIIPTPRRALVITTLPRSRSLEERGHVVHRSIDDIHDAITQRVVHSPPTAAPVLPKHGTKIAPAPRRNSGQSRKRYDTAGCAGNNVHGRCLALRDYYPFWRENLEAAGAGKLLPVDLSENPEVSAPRNVGLHALLSTPSE